MTAPHRVTHLDSPAHSELKRAILDWACGLLEPAVGTSTEDTLERFIIEEDPEMIRTILLQERQRVQDQARQEGRQEGRQESAVAMLTRLLEQRFGALPPDIRDALAAGSLDDLDRWTSRLLVAPTLETVFAD